MYPQYGPPPPPGYYPPPGYPGVPPPMYGPPPMPLVGRNTQEGLKYMSYYILLGIVTNIIGFFMALAAISAPAAMVGLSCLVSGLGLLLILMVIIAIAKCWEGRMEYGPGHEKNVKMALYAFVMIIIMTCVLFAVSFALGLAIVMSGNVRQVILEILVVAGAIGVIDAILWGLIELNLVKQFTTAEENSKAYLAILMMIIGQVVSIGVSLYLNSTTNLITSSSTSYMTYIGGIFPIIGAYIFYTIYKNVMMKLGTGQIQPQAPMMPGMPPGAVPMPPPGYMPPPGAPPMYGPPPYPPQNPV